MGVYRTLAALALIFLVPLGAAAAPAGKVVIAQGVDPTTLDMMNQSETPASNLGRHIFDTLYERDQSLKVVPTLRPAGMVAPYTVRVRTKNRCPTFPVAMTSVQGAMYPPMAYKEKDTTF